MCFSYGLARKFVTLTFFELTLKFLYLIGLIIYLIYYAAAGKANNFVFNRLNDVIEHMGVWTLFIAALVAFALECICLHGLRTGKCWAIFAYLLMHISVVPLYLYYCSNFQYLWLFYVGSLITSILLVYMLIFVNYYKDDQDDVEANRAQRSGWPNSSQYYSSDSESEAEPEVVATPIREKNLPKPKNPQPGGAQNQARGKQSEAKPAVVATGVQQKNLPKGPKPKANPEARTAAQSQTQNDQKTKQKATNQESSFVLPIPTFAFPKRNSVLPVPASSAHSKKTSVLPIPTTPYQEPTDATEECDRQYYNEEEDGEEETPIPASALPKPTDQEPISSPEEPVSTPQEPTATLQELSPEQFSNENYQRRDYQNHHRRNNWNRRRRGNQRRRKQKWSIWKPHRIIEDYLRRNSQWL